MSDQRIASNDLTVWTYDWVPDGPRGHVSRDPPRLCGRVRVCWPRVSACTVLSHARKGRPLGPRTKALRAEPKLDMLNLGSK